MTHDEMIAVIQAHKDGKTIQYRNLDLHNNFHDFNNNNIPVWNFQSCEYRIKTEPREVWVNVYSDGTACLHKNEDRAYANRRAGGKTVRFVEDMSYVHSD